ncbi:hypothetical protein GYA25_02410 [Candidatus Woesearchaeota archaeon]|nr:hypothetical protein [Candidatus Woesearchaeota archaeon]
MIEWIILAIIALIVGYFFGKYLTGRTKLGDKEMLLNAQWEKKVAQIEKDYEIKLEKDKSLLEKLKEENKTSIEKVTKEWQVRYIQDIEELKKLFKDSEKIIKTKSVSSSRRSLVGKFIERFIPFLKKIPYEPSDMHFLGQPIDYIVFQGLHQDNVERVIFVEVKTGNSKLTKREKSLKEAIEKKKVSWKEIDVDTSNEETPDEEMENEETSIDELYDTINEKVASVKRGYSLNKKIENLELKESENNEEYDYECDYCGKIFDTKEECESHEKACLKKD